MRIENGKKVVIHYEGKLKDGTIFDTSIGKEPLEFVFGSGSIIPGLEKGLEGLEKGDKKEISVNAKDAYGEVNPEAVQKVPKEQFPQDITPEIGMQLMAQTETSEIPVVIKDIQEDFIIIDFNHPLAGKDLIFSIEVMDVK